MGTPQHTPSASLFQGQFRAARKPHYTFPQVPSVPTKFPPTNHQPTLHHSHRRLGGSACLVHQRCQHPHVPGKVSQLKGALVRGATQVAGGCMGQGRHHARALAAQETLAGAGRPHRSPLLAVVLRGIARALEGDWVVGGTVRGAALVVGRRRFSPIGSAAPATTTAASTSATATATAPMLTAVFHASPRSHSCIAIIIRLTPSLQGLACSTVCAATHDQVC